jgi:cobalt-zinc-cadmium efflux system protein
MYTLIHKLIFGIIINTCFTVFELCMGYYAGSLSLVSDACHNFTDVVSLCLTLTAHKLAKKKPTTIKSYGYGKATILVSLVNGCILLVLACSIFYGAYHRLSMKEPIEGALVMGIGFLGIVINGGIALLFLKEQHDLVVRSAFLNMIFDALASAGALSAGLFILCTGYTAADTFVSIGLGCLLVISSFRLTREALHLLLEGTPSSVDPLKVATTIKIHPAVCTIDNLHVWALSSTETALTCHIMVSTTDVKESTALIKELKRMLKNEYLINHTTIQVELHPCSSLCTENITSSKTLQ